MKFDGVGGGNLFLFPHVIFKITETITRIFVSYFEQDIPKNLSFLDLLIPGKLSPNFQNQILASHQRTSAIVQFALLIFQDEPTIWMAYNHQDISSHTIHPHSTRIFHPGPHSLQITFTMTKSIKTWEVWIVEDKCRILKVCHATRWAGKYQPGSSYRIF